jgi:hypothetical protein
MYENIDITPFLTREYVFRHVRPRLYNKSYYDNFYGANRMFGKYLDMLVGYQVNVPELTTEDRNVSFPIMLEQLGIIGTTVEELHDGAILNLENDELIVPLIDIIAQETDLPREILEAEDPGMILISNKKQLFGAAQILNDSVISNIVERFGNRFFIIPSSVHEMLILPVEYSTNDLSELSDVVKDVNTGHVLPSERLSNSAYLYDEGEIIIIE